MATTDPTAKFFETLAEADHVPLLETQTGTIRFDIGEGKSLDHWYVNVKKGDVKVSHKSAKADAVAVASKALFDELATGKANAMASFLRGRLSGHGDVGLLMSFQRLFPGPPGAKGPERRSR
jgi:putative sterol carrier protein